MRSIAAMKAALALWVSVSKVSKLRKTTPTKMISAQTQRRKIRLKK